MTLILGHTLGTPQLNLLQALEFFAGIGLDGAEIIWQDDYRCGLPESDRDLAKQVARHARSLGLVIGCLTPYITGLNSLDADERHRDIGRYVSCIRNAELLGCERVRVYAGQLLAQDQDRNPDRWARLVESLCDLAQLAKAAGVTLVVENHFNTMTVTAQDAVHLMSAIGLEAVGILYDQANLSFTHSEDFESAIALQARWIRHVHVKDLIFLDPVAPFRAGSSVHRLDPNELAFRPRVVGDGILNWSAILQRLLEAGYEGPLSLEYEYRWQPTELPDPAVGFKTGAERLRTILGDHASRKRVLTARATQSTDAQSPRGG